MEAVFVSASGGVVVTVSCVLRCFRGVKFARSRRETVRLFGCFLFCGLVLNR